MWRLLNKWRYKELGSRSMVLRPIRITPKCIVLKSRVSVGCHGRIQGIQEYAGQFFDPEIVFDEGASAQQNIHLTCAKRIYIGKNTAIAANVTITDINHPYEDINLPVELQQLEVSPVEIGDDCKIYNNAVILPGTVLGKHCVVGANSVVSGKYDPFTIIAGIPARAIKRYDFRSATWVRPSKSRDNLVQPSEER
jgi:acetyltransferase-like isoleucine patch superfamily enzyme